MNFSSRKIRDIALLLSYAGWIYFLNQTNRLAFFVNPIYNKLILASGVVLFTIGIAVLWQPRRFHPADFGKNSFVKEVAILILLLLPLFFGFFFAPKPLSSATALQRGVTSNLSFYGSFNPTAFAKSPEERSIVEWVRILNFDPEPKSYTGQKVNVEGQVVLDPKLPQSHFYISRFVITCCAADARSIVLPVAYDPVTFTPQNDQWLRLEGIMEEGTLNDVRQNVIHLEKTAPILPPANPYEKF